MKTDHEVIKNDEEFLPVRVLRAGDIRATWESGRLRYIQYQGLEVIRMIFPALRDEKWVTIPYQTENEKIIENEGGFEISMHAIFRNDHIHFEADFLVTGSRSGEISFEMNGKSYSDFKSKRNGLCVHHPIPSCAGRQVEIIKPDNISQLSVFPALIDPERPFTDITGMRWVNSKNIGVTLTFEGDHFETEDQRNWGDDSYKTYSGPQYKTPMLHIKNGDSMRHRIYLKMERKSTLAQKALFPETGYHYTGVATNDVTIAWNAMLHGHLTVEVRPGEADYVKKWDQAVQTAKRLNVKIRALVFFNDFSKKGIEAYLTLINEQVRSVLVLSEKDAVAEIDQFNEVYQRLKSKFPKLEVGYGSNSWFANVNGRLHENITCDFLAFLLMPQVHQFDHRSILENLLSQQTILDTIRRKYDHLPVHIFLRFSKTTDPRLHSQFGAWWTLNAIANLANAGVLTLYDLDDMVHSSSPLVMLLKKVKAFDPEYIGFERPAEAEDPMEAVRLSTVFLEKGDERIYFTIKDI